MIWSVNKSEVEYAISVLKEENEVSGARFSTLRAIIVLQEILNGAPSSETDIGSGD